MNDLIDELISAVTACEQADAQDEVSRIKAEILDRYTRLYAAMERIRFDANEAIP